MFCTLPVKRSLKGMVATEWAAERQEMLSHLAGPRLGSVSAGSLWEDGELWGMEGSAWSPSLEAS